VSFRRFLASCGAAILVGLASAPAPADEPKEPVPEKDPIDSDPAPEGLPERIDKAIERGVAWLRKRQREDGSWWENPDAVAVSYAGKREQVYRFPAGGTALAAYTLLKCGVEPDDPAVKRGFAWLRKGPLPKTAYERSMSLLAVTATADPHKKLKASQASGEKRKLTGPFRKWATDLRDGLVAQQAPNGWRYYGRGGGVRGGDEDLSSTQLAALALFAADRAGLPVATAVWSKAMRYAMAQQEANGPEHPRAVVPHGAGWHGPAPTKAKPLPAGPDRARGYAYVLSQRADLHAAERTPSGGMTACGIGTLLLGRYVVLERRAASKDADARSLDLEPVERSILDGAAWLDANWSPFQNPVGQPKSVYYLYCVERAMDVMGSARVGEHLWYFEMADPLLGRQRDDGHWDTGSWPDHSALYDTCFALLFLSRATRGVIPMPVLTESTGGD
jgi:hypothetical protein